MSSKTNIINLAEHLTHSPATILSHALDIVDEAIGDEFDLVDPTSPFMGLLQVGAIQTGAVLQKMDVTKRKVWPKLAQTLAELYPHMSDDDFAGIMGVPNYDHEIVIGFAKDQIIKHAIFDANTGLRHIRIPRDTVFRVSGFNFTAHQPLDISVYPNNEIRAGFDSTVESPILKRKSNLVETGSLVVENSEFFTITIPCDELNIDSLEEPVVQSSSWDVSLSIDSNFHYARGYYLNESNQWIEMHTTHDVDTFDPVNPTMVVKVEEGVVRAFIPDIFVENSQVGSSARVDVYTTNGATEINLRNVDMSDWEIHWSDLNGLSTGFVAPLQDLTSRIIYSTAVSTGGRDGLPFETVRERVIYNKYGKRGAYMAKELEQALSDLGYVSSLRKDTLTDRTYVAAKRIDSEELLLPTGLTTGIGTATEPVTFFTGREDLGYGLVKHDNRATVLPAMLYKETSGGLTPVPQSEYDALLVLNPNALVDTLNSSLYFYSPFYTVLDYSNNLFSSRAYWLEDHEVTYRNLLAQSVALGYTATSTAAAITHANGVYTLTVASTRPQSVEGLKAQLIIDQNGVKYYKTADGSAMGGAVHFTFDFPTRYEIDEDHAFDTKALNSDGVVVDVQIDLTTEFEIAFVTKTDVRAPTVFDDRYNADLWTDVTSGLAFENIGVRFGRHLDGLFLASRTTIQEPTYRTHLVNVPALYEESIYETDANGFVYTINDVTNEITFNKLHSVGDPILDTNGEPTYHHRVGDPIVNVVTQLPEELTGIDYSREVRMPLFDAKFLMANTESIETYRNALPARLYEYLRKDIADLRVDMLERTKLYFEPLTNQQSATVRIAEGRELSMRTALSFNVVYQLTTQAHGDNTFREETVKATKTKLSERLSSKVVSMADIVSELKALAPEKILGVTVSNPLGSTGVAEITDGLSNFSISKSARLRANGQITIVDDVDVAFTK